MNRTKKTLLNAVANFMYLLASGLSGLIVMRVLLLSLGSDYNGLNSTVAQVMAVLSLVSSSFTTASLVSLYEPYNKDDWAAINLVLSTSRRAYRLIGLGMLVVGVAVCVGYSFVVKSNLSYEIVLSVMLLGLVSALFNVCVVNVFRLVFQVSQTEYIVTFIQVAYIIVLTPVACAALVYTRDIVIVRACYVVLDACSGTAVALAARRIFHEMDFGSDYDYSLTRGTRDVFATSLTGIVYRTAPTLFLSTFVGTVATSVYYVYDSVVSIIRNVVQVSIQAPKNAFGQVLHERDGGKTLSVFREYEYVTVASATALLSTTLVLVFPFVMIYVGGVDDANYQDAYLAVVLVVVAFLEVSHIPSGLAIQLAGEFKLAKRIQYSAMPVLVGLLVALGWEFGLHGIVSAVLVTAIWLTGLEVFFSRKVVLKASARDFLALTGVHFALFAVLVVIGRVALIPLINDVISFVVFGGVDLVVNVSLVCVVGRIAFHDRFLGVTRRIATSMPRRLSGSR